MTTTVNFVKVYAQCIAIIVPFTAVGWYIDRCESERMTRFRDKSKLYGRELKPGEAPSWP